MLFTKSLAALAVAALALVPAVHARPAGLKRARCAAKNALKAGGAANVAPAPTPNTTPAPKPKPSGCFPSAGFKTPDSPYAFDLDDWWCSRSSEYAFLGFSYAVDACPSKSSMTASFKQMRNNYGARYVRIYATCDRGNFNDDLVEAAYEAGVGVFALVWFGFNGDASYKGRMSRLLNTVKNNKLAPYVIRNIAIGSEPLYDHAISVSNLVSTIYSVKGQVKKFGIEVSTSEMAQQYTSHPEVINAVDHVELNVLPFFAGDASFGSNAANRVHGDLNAMAKKTNKKLIMTQTGWPSTDALWKANAKSAVASQSSEKAYFDLLDDQCASFKKGAKGGVAWFAHVWEDQGLPGWGIVRGGKPKFNFSARSRC